MTDLQAAAQQALEDICGAKLCEVNSMSSRTEMLRLMDKAITALRAALEEPNRAQKLTEAGYTRRPTLREMAEPVQEPVRELLISAAAIAVAAYRKGAYQGASWVADAVLEPAPPQRPAEPVGVVTSMVKGGVTWHRWPADMPDGTHLYAAPAQRPAEPVQKQEPVAWMFVDDTGMKFVSVDQPHKHCQPLYAAPPQRKPLDDLAIADIYAKWDATPGVSMADFARAVEAAHGIKDGT